MCVCVWELKHTKSAKHFGCKVDIEWFLLVYDVWMEVIYPRWLDGLEV